MITDDQYYASYRDKWGNGPHLTADAYMVISDSYGRDKAVLLIRRKNAPGKGLLALPGGFLDIDRGETFFDAAKRELFEETGLIATEHNGMHLADDPARSRRGRVISNVFRFQYDYNKMGVPRAADDAESVEFYPMNDVIRMDSNNFFEDHHSIICAMAYMPRIGRSTL